jgi:hypothetical protein
MVGALVVFAVGCGGGSPGKSANPGRAPAKKRLSVPEIAKLARSSVVVVRTSNGLGTGFVVAPGVIATNLHVIARASEIAIDVSPTVTSPVTWIMGFDRAHDLALVYVGAALELEPVKLGDDTLVRAGDPVVAVGTPQGFELSVSTGIVSAVRTLDENTTLLQVTAPISSGSSGGPLFDDRGTAIGVTTMIWTQGQNLNFAVPSRYIIALLEQRSPPMSIEKFSKLSWSDSAPVPEEARAPASRPKFPDAVAGFALGATLKVTSDACPGRLQKGSNYAECSMPPVEVPFASGPVRLYFSKGRLVSVGLRGNSFEEVLKVLVEKYGKPDHSSAQTPDERAGRVPLPVQWNLEGGNIVLRIEPKARSVEVSYVVNVWNEAENY